MFSTCECACIDMPKWARGWLLLYVGLENCVENEPSYSPGEVTFFVHSKSVAVFSYY